MDAVDARVGEGNKTLGLMVESVAAITESSGKISKITKVIDEIAFQTNILALNAAVEAARAGRGRHGFRGGGG
jgi:methyl-accepting chemotaxis protein